MYRHGILQLGGLPCTIDIIHACTLGTISRAGMEKIQGVEALAGIRGYSNPTASHTQIQPRFQAKRKLQGQGRRGGGGEGGGTNRTGIDQKRLVLMLHYMQLTKEEAS